MSWSVQTDWNRYSVAAKNITYDMRECSEEEFSAILIIG